MLKVFLNLTAASFLLGINLANAQKLGSDEATFQQLEKEAARQLRVASQLAAAAAAQREKLLNEKGSTRTLFFTQERVISCLRNGLQNQYSNMVMEAVPWVREAALSWDNSNRLNEIGTTCERYLNSQVPNPKLTKGIQLYQVEQLTKNPAERAFFDSMLNPVTQCVDDFKERSAGFVVMVNVGDHSYYCSSSDGLEWSQRGRARAYGVGFGRAVYSTGGPVGDQSRRDRDDDFEQSKYGKTILVFLAGVAQTYSSKGSTNETAFGFAAGFVGKNRISFTPKVITNNANEKIQRQVVSIYKSLTER